MKLFIRYDAEVIFCSFCDAPTKGDESQKEESVGGVPTITKD